MVNKFSQGYTLVRPEFKTQVFMRPDPYILRFMLHSLPKGVFLNTCQNFFLDFWMQFIKLMCPIKCM